MIGLVRCIGIVSRALGALAAVMLLASASAAVSAVDDAGARIELVQPAARVISLAPHVTASSARPNLPTIPSPHSAFPASAGRTASTWSALRGSSRT